MFFFNFNVYIKKISYLCTFKVNIKKHINLYINYAE